MVRFGITVGIAAAILVCIMAASWQSPAPRRVKSTYFPEGALRSDPAADELYDEWYSSLLRQMHVADAPMQPSQPSLYEPPRNGPKRPHDYRALITRDREYLIAIHIFDGDNGPEVMANEIDFRQSGRTRAVHRKLNGTEWGNIIHTMPDTGMFIPPHAPAHFKGDCVDWVIEEREGEQYNVMSESCPTNPAFVKLGQAFLDAAGWSAY